MHSNVLTEKDRIVLGYLRDGYRLYVGHGSHGQSGWAQLGEDRNTRHGIGRSTIVKLRDRGLIRYGTTDKYAAELTKSGVALAQKLTAPAE